MPLEGYISDCELHAPIIKSVDKGNSQSHIGINKGREFAVTHYRIDGNVITEGKRCDFLLINEDKKSAYFIELKGSDLCTAAEQLETTERVLSTKLSAYPNRFYRIVAKKCKTQEIESTAFRKFKIKWKNALLYKTQTIEENI